MLCMYYTNELQPIDLVGTFNFFYLRQALAMKARQSRNLLCSSSSSYICDSLALFSEVIRLQKYDTMHALKSFENMNWVLGIWMA